jgi:serine O-acetyltransferase
LRWPLVIRFLLLEPGIQLLFSIRLQRRLERIPLIGIGIRRVVWYWTTVLFGCDIHPGARFGNGIYIPHPIGIVIGQEWDIGDDVTILQGVTLGRVRSPVRRCTVGRGAFLGAGAKILGSIDVGANAMIGANAVVLNDVAAGCTAVGVPARVVENASECEAPANIMMGDERE